MTVKELRELLSNYHDNELVGVEAPGIGGNVRAITGVGERLIYWQSELGGFESKESGTYSVILTKN